MFLRVEHTTEFTYDAPIAEAYTELRLRPLEGGGQHCSSFRLVTEPFGLRVREYRDHFGNDVQHFDVLESHDRLVRHRRQHRDDARSFDRRPRRASPLELHDYLTPDRLRAVQPAASGSSPPDTLRTRAASRGRAS